MPVGAIDGVGVGESEKYDLYNKDIKKSSSNLLEIQAVQLLYPCSLLMVR